jgi:hypothetical protein
MTRSLPVLGLPAPTQIELEFTNRCNARCTACPRSDMPVYGRMTSAVLLRILSLYTEYEHPLTAGRPRLVIAGGGEPLLHPQAVELLAICRASGLHVTLISNASRFHAVDLDAVFSNVDQLLVSFWGIEATEYELAMKLDFEHSLANVEHAKEIAAACGREFAVQWLRTPHLRSDAKSIRRFWAKRGIMDVRGGDVVWNRAGALEAIDLELDRSESLKPDFERQVWCSDLFFSDSWAWSGDLVLCCCDYFTSGQTLLGHCNTLTQKEISSAKQKLLDEFRASKCEKCKLPRRHRAVQLAEDVLARLPIEEQRLLMYAS